MPIHALDAIDEAVGPTRSLVSRLGIAGWLRLGAVTLFVGGFGSVSFSANLPGEALALLPVNGWQPAHLGSTLGTIGLVVGAAAALSAFYLVRSVLEFVLYDALRTGTVAVRRSLRRWWVQGVQLWAFHVVLAGTLLGGGSAVASAVGATGRTVPGVPNEVLVAATVACSFGAYAVVAGFTTRFVVPVVLIRETGVLPAWGRFLRTVAERPGQYVWYLVVGPFVRFVADVLAVSAAVLLAVLLAVPVAVFVLPSLMIASIRPELALSPPLLLLTAGLTAGYGLAVLAGAVLARLPFVVYVRYYAVSVLRGTDPRLDLFASPGADGEVEPAVFRESRHR